MRHVITNKDGSVVITACVPIAFIRKSDSKRFKFSRHLLRDNKQHVYVVADDGEELKLVGDDGEEIHDISHPDFTVVWPDIDTDIIAKWHSNERIKVASHRPIPKAEIPTDRYFRAAWKDGGGKIDVDMSKAREIQRDVIRAKRASMLADLDTQYMRADEAGNTAEKARIAAEKQKLRDFTKDPRIDAAKTPEELKSILP